MHMKCHSMEGGDILNANALKAEMILKNKRVPEIIKNLQISRSSFYRKLNGESDFNRDEIVRISKALDFDNEKLIKIFFSD